MAGELSTGISVRPCPGVLLGVGPVPPSWYSLLQVVAYFAFVVVLCLAAVQLIARHRLPSHGFISVVSGLGATVPALIILGGNLFWLVQDCIGYHAEMRLDIWRTETPGVWLAALACVAIFGGIAVRNGTVRSSMEAAGMFLVVVSQSLDSIDFSTNKHFGLSGFLLVPWIAALFLIVACQCLETNSLSTDRVTQ